MIIIKIIISGFFLLFFAIIINAIVQLLKIMTWYDLLMELKKKSWPRKMRVIDFAWLFLGYPFFLGLIIFYVANFFLI